MRKVSGHRCPVRPADSARSEQATRPPRAAAPETRRVIAKYWLIAAVVVVSIAARAAHLASVYPTPALSLHRTWINSDMYLFDQWAQRIVQGDVVGRQTYHPLVDWMLHTAPTDKWNQWFGTTPVFLKAPLYTYLIALLRWLFGDAMPAMALLQILASALCAVLIFLITERLFDTATGAAAGLLFAVYAPAIHYDVVLLRGPWILLTGLLLTWQLTRLRSQPTATEALFMGATAGVAILFNEASLPLPLLVLVLMAWWVRGPRRLAMLAGAFVIGLVAVLTPLIVRNLIVGVPPLSLAITGSYGFAMCNTADAQPLFFRGPGPSFVPLMEQSGAKMTNLLWLCLQSFHGIGNFLLFYLRRAAGLVVPLENPDNANFYYAALRSPVLRWLPTYAILFPLSVVGVGLSFRKLPATSPLLPLALTTIVTMTINLPMSRYRIALAALLCPFAGLTLVQGIRFVREQRVRALIASVAAVAALSATARLLERHVVFRNMDWRAVYYRLADFQIIALGYSGQNRFREASHEYLQLAQLTPLPQIQTQAWLVAAQLLARAGDTQEARHWLEAAARTEGTDAATIISIGDSWQAMGDAGNALAAYRKAAALRPGGQLGRQLQQRLARAAAPP